MEALDAPQEPIHDESRFSRLRSALASILLPRRPRPPSTYYLSSWLFLRLLALVYLIAIISLWVQLDGLIGSRGLLPLGEFLQAVEQRLGSQAYFQLPTLCWFGHDDLALHLLCGGGVVLALLAMAGVAQLWSLLGLWAVYLSLVHAGQTFLSFQWDTLLLEAGFAALFLAPTEIRPRWPWRQVPPARAALWLLWFLVFKLMFLSGVVKLISKDETWWSLTALDYHYYTQPLPTWTSWYMHQLPRTFHRVSVFLMFLGEIGASCLIFCGRLGRILACLALISLQLLVAATGNYCFFNLLSIMLCLVLLDDSVLYALLPQRVQARHQGRRAAASIFLPRQLGRGILILILMLLSGLTLVREMVRTVPASGIGEPAGRLLEWGDRYLLSWGEPYLLRFSDPFRSVNGYGLFRAMTTARPEIIVEGSADGTSWREYAFKWKPGDVSRRPRFVAPHQPRLDWQMWFAALNPRRAEHWMQMLILRLLQGSPVVLGLLDSNPFPDQPPRYIRLAYYRYEFTDREEGRRTCAWWKRERASDLTRPLSIEDFGPNPKAAEH